MDFLFAPLPQNSVPNDTDIMGLAQMNGLEDTVAYTLAGPAVAFHMLKLVPNVKTFRECLRGIKYWAVKRGIYGNKFTYPGGVAVAVLVARVCQLHPKACASTLLTKFFTTYSIWFSTDTATRRNPPVFLTEILTVTDPEMAQKS